MNNIKTQSFPAFPTRPSISNLKVLYIGGLNSVGKKAWAISQAGYITKNPRLKNNSIVATAARFLPGFMSNLTGLDNYKQRLIDQVANECKNFTPDLIVGMSQGGAIAMEMAQTHFPNARLLLLAPAWNTFGVEPIVRKDTIIVHGQRDWVVPIRDSQSLAKKNDCELISIEESHQLDADETINFILDLVDEISIKTGKHKDEATIKAEKAAYEQAYSVWFANCTKQSMLMTTAGPIYITSTSRQDDDTQIQFVTR